MTAQTANKRLEVSKPVAVTRAQWLKIGLAAALVAIVLVVLAQMVALAIWPETAAFRPLNNYPRTILFTLIPAVVATALFAWQARSGDPTAKFIKIAAFVLLISFIPDYTLPVPNRTFLASSIAAFLHIVAGLAITGMLITGYHRAIARH